MVVAYVVRHGVTDMSPSPEWWSQIPLNDLGVAQARDAGQFLKTLKKTPDWVVSSDLRRAIQTGQECAQILGIEVMKPLEDLRAIGKNEKPHEFESRNARCFSAIFRTASKTKKIPLIACHRSNTAFLAKLLAGTRQELDYREASAVREGGVIEIRPNSLVPLYRQLAQNPRADIAQPDDGTQVSGFVTAKDNKPPRQCEYCRWMKGGACLHPVVTADDGLGLMYGKHRNKNGNWMVAEEDCCNSFQNRL